ncbi:MAG: polysaccharide deacetylase family protein [Sporichthyaceae bacterium]
MHAKLPIQTAAGALTLALAAACGSGPDGAVAAPTLATTAAASAAASPSAPATVPSVATPVAAAANSGARLVVNVPGYDSPGARVPLLLTLLDAPADLAPEALTASASNGARVLECGPSWRNPTLDSISRACQLLVPNTTVVTAQALWRTPAGLPQTVRAKPSTVRAKGPRTGPMSAAEAARIDACGNDSDHVWLTFDDYVPSLQTARTMVEVLGRNKARGRFLLNRIAPAVRELLESSGHVVTNHTRDHVALSDLSDAAIREQVEGGPATTRGEVAMLRPPYGAGSWSQRVADALEAAGHLPCRWTVDTADYTDRSAERMAGAVRWGDAYSAPVQKGGVVLMHANHFSTAKLQAVLDAIRVRGLTPEPNPKAGS